MGKEKDINLSKDAAAYWVFELDTKSEPSTEIGPLGCELTQTQFHLCHLTCAEMDDASEVSTSELASSAPVSWPVRFSAFPAENDAYGP